MCYWRWVVGKRYSYCTDGTGVEVGVRCSVSEPLDICDDGMKFGVVALLVRQ